MELVNMNKLGVAKGTEVEAAVMGNFKGETEEVGEQIMASKASFTLPRYGWDVEPPLQRGADGRYPSALPGLTKLG